VQDSINQVIKIYTHIQWSIEVVLHNEESEYSLVLPILFDFIIFTTNCDKRIVFPVLTKFSTPHFYNGEFSARKVIVFDQIDIKLNVFSNTY